MGFFGNISDGRSGKRAANRPNNGKVIPMSKGERTGAADVARLRAARRCGARTRAGTLCRSPAVQGRPRCRMHGCGGGRLHRSGAPRGNRNAWKDGYWAAAARARRRAMTGFIRDMEASLAEIEAMVRSPAPAYAGSFSGAWGCFPLFLSDTASRASPEWGAPVWCGGECEVRGLTSL